MVVRNEEPSRFGSRRGTDAFFSCPSPPSLSVVSAAGADVAAGAIDADEERQAHAEDKPRSARQTGKAGQNQASRQVRTVELFACSHTFLQSLLPDCSGESVRNTAIPHFKVSKLMRQLRRIRMA